jgi:lycopene cyclase domain-containing protein
MSSAYFWINILTIIGPLALSFDKKVAFASKWRLILPAILIPAFLYLVWDFIFTRLGVWHFNSEYIFGAYVLNLPAEEIGFFLAIPYACLFIYECLRCYAPGEGSKAFAIIFGWLLVCLCALALVL